MPIISVIYELQSPNLFMGGRAVNLLEESMERLLIRNVIPNGLPPQSCRQLLTRLRAPIRE